MGVIARRMKQERLSGAEITREARNAGKKPPSSAQAAYRFEDVNRYALVEQMANRPLVSQNHEFNMESSPMEAIGQMTSDSFDSSLAEMIEENRHIWLIFQDISSVKTRAVSCCNFRKHANSAPFMGPDLAKLASESTFKSPKGGMLSTMIRLPGAREVGRSVETLRFLAKDVAQDMSG